jgi:integrase
MAFTDPSEGDPEHHGTTIPTVAQYMTTWLAQVVQPARELSTYTYYETMARRYIVPALGTKRLDKLHPRDVQAWLDDLSAACQCCAQGKDASRPEPKRFCCAVGRCCGARAGDRTIQAARNTLRAALNHARIADHLVRRNVAVYVTLPGPVRQDSEEPAWTAEQAHRFLASSSGDNDPFYAAYVLILINGLSRGEALGLVWPSAGLDRRDLDTTWQLQRVGRQLIHKQRPETGDNSPGRIVPMPEICATALKLRHDEQDVAREQAGDHWQPSDLVFTTRRGTPIDPRNFNRSFDTRCRKAAVPRITIRDARRTCPLLLAALDVHPDAALPILRHAKITMAAEAYIKLRGEITRTAPTKPRLSATDRAPADPSVAQDPS